MIEKYPMPLPRPDRQHPAAIREVTRRYYGLWWIYSFAGGFLFGVYPLFLRARGLDQFQINSVMAVYFVVIFLTDIPTGAFADSMGRRNSFLLGCALRTVAFLTYFFVHSYALIILAEIVDGVGTTFCSGAIDAWGVDALDEAGFGGLKDRLFSRISQLMNLGFMGSALIGAYIADLNIAWPWLAGAAGYLASGAAGAMLMREERPRRAAFALEPMLRQVSQRIGKGLRQGFGRREVLFLSLANGICFAAWAPYWLQWPQLFNDGYGLGVWIVGWIYCVLTLGHVIGAESAARLEASEGTRGLHLSLLAIISGVLLFGAGAVAGRPNVALALLVLMRICTGALQPLVNSWLNEQIGADERATLLSFTNSFATLGGSGGLLLGGALADRLGIPATWGILGLVAALAAPCFWALRLRTNPRSAMPSTVE